MAHLKDPAVIRQLLETDRSWAVYALGDLAPVHFQHSVWHGLEGEQALVLFYRKFSPPVLFTLGRAEVIGMLLEEAADVREMTLHVRPEIIPVLRERWDVSRLKTMLRMILNPARFPRSDFEAHRLAPADLGPLERLYADGAPSGESPDFFSAAMLEEGAYFGIWENEDLIAAAGTHLVVPAEGVAAIGNIYTRRDRRSRGLATCVTGAVAAALLRHELLTIALNVHEHNTPAIRVYEQLGFERYCTFVEGKAVRR